ncbi:hypothetical protein ACT3CE_05145 [Marinifilum sp. RC60d5]|uniref:hypothetical protein n=1 Tax=Marinifilum sp. RC60d5 TaxID=3458414 RepID=UPI004036D510
MKEIKDRWQLIIGFAAIIISLSAFKDELNKIIVDFQFISFSLSQYLFILIISFISVIHLYVIPFIFSTTKYSNLKVFKHIESLSYILFLVIILSPSLLLIIYLLQLLILQISVINETAKSVSMSILSAIIGAITTYFSKYVVGKYQSSKKSREDSEIIEKEVKSFEIADKLIKDGYYNQSLFETFKMLENGIYKALRQRDLIFRKAPFLEMIRISDKYNIFTKGQIEQINRIRIKRNEFAHNISSTITKAEAEDAQNLAKEILANTENIETENIESENKYFLGKVHTDLKHAKELSKKANKPMFVVIYNKLHPKLSKLEHSLGYFMEYETTKKMVNNNFIQVLTDSEKPEVKELIPAEEPLENCLLTVLTPDNGILRQEGVYANPDEGLKRTKEIIAKWNKTTSS